MLKRLRHIVMHSCHRELLDSFLEEKKPLMTGHERLAREDSAEPDRQSELWNDA